MAKKVYGTVDFIVTIYNLGEATSSTNILLDSHVLSLQDPITLQAKDKEVQTREITNQFDWMNIFLLHGWDSKNNRPKTIQEMGFINGINQLRVAINLDSRGNCMSCGGSRIRSSTFQADICWQIRENME